MSYLIVLMMYCVWNNLEMQSQFILYCEGDRKLHRAFLMDSDKWYASAALKTCRNPVANEVNVETMNVWRIMHGIKWNERIFHISFSYGGEVNWMEMCVCLRSIRCANVDSI